LGERGEGLCSEGLSGESDGEGPAGFCFAHPEDGTLGCGGFCGVGEVDDDKVVALSGVTECGDGAGVVKVGEDDEHAF